MSALRLGCFEKLHRSRKHPILRRPRALLRGKRDSLQVLNLWGINITDFSLSKFQDIKKISLFNATGVSNAKLRQISPSVEEMELGRSDLTGCSFARFVHLRKMHFRYVKNLANDQQFLCPNP